MSGSAEVSAIDCDVHPAVRHHPPAESQFENTAGGLRAFGANPSYNSITTYSSSTLTGNVSATYGPSTGRAPGSTVTGKLRARPLRGSIQDLPARTSYSR